MDKRSTKTAIAIVLLLVGIAVLAIFQLNVFTLDLPRWSYFASTTIGLALTIWGATLLIFTYIKQK